MKYSRVRAAVPDADVLAWYGQVRRAATGNDFVQPPLQRIVAIACALREASRFKIASVGEIGDGEAELVRRFFEILDRCTPQLVSWNGSGFDLPVLHYRAMIHGVTAARYWDWGDDDREFKFNNYLARYHTRHIDLMDVLSIYGGRGSPLDELARLAGFPGKLGVGGAAVWESYRAGRLEAIRSYCEADTVNTYLLFLRFQLMRCAYNAERYESECRLLRAALDKRPEPHWREFLSLWPA